MSIKSVPFNQAMNQAPRTIIDAVRVKNDGELPKAMTEQDLVDLKSVFKEGSREATFLSQQLFRFYGTSNTSVSSSGAIVGMMTKDEAKTSMGLVSSLISALSGKDE